jgi:hypothetical protein
MRQIYQSGRYVYDNVTGDMLVECIDEDTAALFLKVATSTKRIVWSDIDRQEFATDALIVCESAVVKWQLSKHIKGVRNWLFCQLANSLGMKPIEIERYGGIDHTTVWHHLKRRKPCAKEAAMLDTLRKEFCHDRD